MGRHPYDLYVAEDRARQATEALRQALGVLYAGHPAYPHVRAALTIVGREWHEARAALDNAPERYAEATTGSALREHHG